MILKEKISVLSKNIVANPRSLIIIPAALFFLAFLPRVMDLGTGLTTDETVWVARAPSFIDAVFQGDFVHTYVTNHPGVTLMWISGFFIKFFSYPEMDFHQFLLIARIPVAIITALGILLMYFLLKKLLNEKIAVIATVLIGLDPFYLAYSRIIHLDALVTTFMVLTILSFLLYILECEKDYLLISAGIFLGFGFLTKLPALTLIPYLILVFSLSSLADSYSNYNNLKRSVMACISIAVFTRFFKTFFIILLIGGLVFVTLWPVMWISPIQTLEKIAGGINNVIENPHENKGFFLGQITNSDKFGPLYYIVVVLMKTTPVVLIFSIICIISLSFSYWRKKVSKMNFTILCLLLYVILFFALMSLGGKKGARYILPIFPIIDIIAATGIYYCYKCIPNLLMKIVNKFDNFEQYENTFFGIIVILVIILQAFLVMPLTPYYLSYSNPLVFGGAEHSTEYITIGWGEGLDLAAEYLNSKPDATNLTIATQYIGFKEYFKGKTISMKDLNTTPPDYLVFYSCTVQRNIDNDLWEKYKNKTPEKVIVINNINYCWIYPTHVDETPGKN